MPKRFYKHKLLFDENMPLRRSLPRLNEHFDVKHVRDDLHHDGASDEFVYQELALPQGRIVLTHNVSDFRALISSEQDPGVINIPEAWSASRLDTKLTALLMKHPPSYFRGRVVSLSVDE